MADSSFLLSTFSLAQMEPTGSKDGTWKAMGGRSVRWRLWVEAMRKRREGLGYNGRNSHFNSENLFHFGWLTLSSGGLWLRWVLTPMVGSGFANDGVGGVMSNFGDWALTIWVFGGGS
ncbi:hypothetical protein FCV25MIE_01900 [Fagus crenata]